eukprot:CAMPEP_0194329502 /NCGR_PEP_ID=MMETSP0171-20130528/48546_1 /TAXON_ID=218684 /ORGANISM="Corethron pennatum, Strain L29A3" /LENGTH=63 /DNA_ID=CAMNT_0039090259 /DNA_START=51 /DNA_END=239 /DNA_ORIENTATION=+
MSPTQSCSRKKRPMPAPHQASCPVHSPPPAGVEDGALHQAQRCLFCMEAEAGQLRVETRVEGG